MHNENQEASAKTLKQDFSVSAKNIHIVPFFSEIHAEEKDFERNICFIGTKFCNDEPNCINSFMNSKPTKDEIQKYKKLIQKVKDEPFIDEDEF